MAHRQRELVDFLSHRFARNSAALLQLRECRSWEDALALQSVWLKEAQQDYSGSLIKLLGGEPQGSRDHQPT